MLRVTSAVEGCTNRARAANRAVSTDLPFLLQMGQRCVIRTTLGRCCRANSLQHMVGLHISLAHSS